MKSSLLFQKIILTAFASCAASTSLAAPTVGVSQFKDHVILFTHGTPSTSLPQLISNAAPFKLGPGVLATGIRLGSTRVGEDLKLAFDDKTKWLWREAVPGTLADGRENLAQAGAFAPARIGDGILFVWYVESDTLYIKKLSKFYNVDGDWTVSVFYSAKVEPSKLVLREGAFSNSEVAGELSILTPHLEIHGFPKVARQTNLEDTWQSFIVGANSIMGVFSQGIEIPGCSACTHLYLAHTSVGSHGKAIFGVAPDGVFYPRVTAAYSFEFVAQHPAQQQIELRLKGNSQFGARFFPNDKFGQVESGPVVFQRKNGPAVEMTALKLFPWNFTATHFDLPESCESRMSDIAIRLSSK